MVSFTSPPSLLVIDIDVFFASQVHPSVFFNEIDVFVSFTCPRNLLVNNVDVFLSFTRSTPPRSE